MKEGSTISQPVSLEVPKERTILVSAPTKDIPPREADEHLEELGRLADTAQANVVSTLRQRLDNPHPKYYIGEGKANELKDMSKELEAGLVIFDEELAPAQGKNLETLLGVRVMDRTELILDIFATRARSAEAQMQVELAQLQYLMPRLRRMWTHLSRIRGGIGLRGPGETQLETDRRIIGRRIRDLKERLEVVARRRATQRKGRTGEYRAALVGYTNAGKSSILRSFSGAEVLVEDRLFATLDPTTRTVDLGPGGRALLTDTVGFIRKLPHGLVASFRSTLEEALEADVLLHVVDASHPEWEDHVEVVDEVLDELGASERPMALVFNKVDRLTHEEEDEMRLRASADFDRPILFVSAVEQGGLEPLREYLLAQLTEQRPEVRLVIAATDGEALATVYRDGEVLDRVDEDSRIMLVARVPRPTLGRLERRESVSVVDAEP